MACSKKRDEITVSWVTDFDGTMYKLQSGNPEDSKASNLLCMSVKLEGYSEIAKARPAQNPRPALCGAYS